MYKVLGMVLAGACAACGHAQTTGSAYNDWRTPVGMATATHPTRVDPTTGEIVNSAAYNHGYDSRYNDAFNAPSSFGMVPPPALQAAAGPYGP
jgi:hypothetical protein